MNKTPSPTLTLIFNILYWRCEGKSAMRGRHALISPRGSSALYDIRGKLTYHNLYESISIIDDLSLKGSRVVNIL